MKHGIFFVAFVAAAVTATTTARAQATRAEPRRQIDAYLLLGFFGNAELDVDDAGSTSRDLDPSLGFGLRYQHPLTDFLALGGLFEFRSFEPDDPDLPEDADGDRQPSLDLDVFLKLGWTVPAGEKALQVYGLVPFGLTIAPGGRSNPLTLGSDTALGFNVGVLAGFEALLSDRFALFIELGWRRHQWFAEEAGVDADFVMNQFAMNVGASLLL